MRHAFELVVSIGNFYTAFPKERDRLFTQPPAFLNGYFQFTHLVRIKSEQTRDVKRNPPVYSDGFEISFIEVHTSFTASDFAYVNDDGVLHFDSS
jgi:hypothetical protein